MLTFTPEVNIHISNHVGTHVCLTTPEEVSYYYDSETEEMECYFTITKCDIEEWNSFMACLNNAKLKNGSLWTITIEEFQKDKENVIYGAGVAFEATSFTKTRDRDGHIQFRFKGYT